MRTLTSLAVLVVYVVAGRLGLALAFVHASATAVWPPAGIALAALLLFGNRVAVAIFAGAFIVNISTSGSVVASLGIAVGNTLEALLGAHLVRRFAGGAAAFERAQDIFKLAALAAVASTAVSATIGVASLILTGSAPWDDVESIWLTWWLGDAAGILIVTPFVVLWWRRPVDPPLARRPAEALALLAGLVGAALVVFGGLLPQSLRNLPITYVCIPPLLWAAYRFGPRETSLAMVVLSAISIAGTLRGWGPFAGRPPAESLGLLQPFLATIALATLPLAAVVSERRRATDAARMREEQLRVAMAAAQMGTWEWTIATGEVRWSASLEAMHGLAPGTFAGTYEAFQADIHPDDRETVAAAIRGSLERGGHRLEYRIVKPDGTVRWVEGRGEMFRDTARRPQRVIGVCVDITERRRADERNRVFADIARSISASLDLDTVLQRIADGARILCESDTAAIFLRDPTSDAMTPRYRVGPWLPAYDAFRLRPGEGLGGQAMQTGQPVRTTRYGADPRVDARLQAIAAATGAVALLVVPILIGAHVAGLLYISNRSAREFSDDDEAISRRLAVQAAIAIQNARLFAREGTARAEAEAASRSKDEFLAMLGHELRNPLGAISNAVHVLERAADPAAALRAREIVARQVQHLARLMDDLLDVARATSGKITLQHEVVDVADIVQRAMRTLEARGATARHDLALEVRPVHVRGDAVRLEQVVANLVENALKYTPSGGRISVAVEESDGAAVLTVEDCGVGIAPELLPRVFDLFVQADRSLDRTGGGLGIGLTLVRRLVELHGGSVEATSAGVGRGSRFTVRLAATSAAAGLTPVREADPPDARRILVVEDNDDAREMLCHLGRLLGHEVHEAAEGLGGVEAALRLRPDLTFVDIGLPGLDGYEVARRIRADPRGQALRLVALTGYGSRVDRERALTAGYDEHLVKPVDPARIAAMLRA